MLAKLRPRMQRARDDEGFALMSVLMLMLVMAVVCTVVLASVLSGSQFQRKQQDWNAALAAAQAGVDDYIQRLNSDNGDYYQYNGTSSIDPDNAAMGKDAAGKPRWAPVPQSGAGTRAYFHYETDTSAYTGAAGIAQTGVITVTSTGKVGSRTRTIKTEVRRKGFLDNLYFTEYETEDPDTPSSENAGKAYCKKHYYENRAADCSGIQFQDDRLSGPVHSNDTMLICFNVTFTGQVTTASTDQGGGKYYRSNECSRTTPAPVFQDGAPAAVGQQTMPDTNTSLKAQTQSPTSPMGCLYVGPTLVTLNGSRMWVHSPWTKTVNYNEAQGVDCRLDRWVDVPANGVVYVDDLPANGTTDPNSYNLSNSADREAYDRVQAACTQQGGNPVGYPVKAAEGISTANEAGWSYGCTTGDVFIQELNGQAANGLTGRLTVATAGSIYVTDNLHYGSSAAILGLIANQNIWYWHGVTADGTNLGLPGKKYPEQAPKSTALQNPTVSAAMVAIKHQIGTMNNRQGASLGTLTINGNITQLFRGVVKRTMYGVPHGYVKNYVYDTRFQYDAPPHFLNPVTSSFAATRSAEVSPAYRVSQ